MSVIAALRQACMPLHQELEAKLNVMETVKTREQYGRLLAKFYSFIAPLEARLEKHENLNRLDLEMSSRRKADWLADDMRTLGVTPVEPVAPENLPAVDDLAAAMGCLYVLEGSTLGGQLMTRHFRQALGLEDGLSFFNGYGPDTGRRWKAYLDSLSRHFDLAPVEVQTHLVEAAYDCFEKMGKALE